MVKIEGVNDALAVPAIIAMESLYRLKHRLIFPMITNNSFDHEFKGKIGQTLTITRPFYATVGEGSEMHVNAKIDKTVDLTIDQRWNGALKNVDQDVTFRLKSYSDRYVKPVVTELAYKYDIAGGREMGNSFFRTNVDNIGKTLDLQMAQDIRAQATEVAIPEDDRNFALVRPTSLANISKELRSLDMPMMVGESIRRQFKGDLADWRVVSSTNIPFYEVEGLPTSAAPQMNGSNQRGTSIVTDGWGVNSARVLRKGTIISIAGVKEIQPRGDREETGRIATFVVTEDVSSDGTGNATIKIYPEINTGSSTLDIIAKSTIVGAKANVDASAFQSVSTGDTDALKNAGTSDNAIITVYGRKSVTAGTAAQNRARYRQAIFFQSDAIEYANITLYNPKSATYSSVRTDPETGVSISFVSDFTITDKSETDRLDIMFGVKNVYPELGIKQILEEVPY